MGRSGCAMSTCRVRWASAGTVGQPRPAPRLSCLPPPAACERGQAVAPRGREAREASWAVGMRKGRNKLLRPMAPAALDAHHHRLGRFAAGRPHWREVLTQLLGRNVRPNVRADLGGALVDRTEDAESPPGEATPGTIRPPRGAVDGLLAWALPLAQRAWRETRARGRAKRQRRVASAESQSIAPRRAWAARAAGAGAHRPVGRAKLPAVFLRPRAHSRGRAGRPSAGPARARVPSNSPGHGACHAGGGLQRRAAGGAGRVRRALSVVVPSVVARPSHGPPGWHHDGPPGGARKRSRRGSQRRLADAGRARRGARLGHGARAELRGSAG
jgi:hypothetical protein